MSATRPSAPERVTGVPWDTRLLAEARRLTGSLGDASATAPSSAELDAAGRDLIALQRGLTGERGLIGASYMDERRALASYLLFYWQISRAQMRGLLSMAFPDGPTLGEGSDRVELLDLGSGPAPCSIAVAERLVEAYSAKGLKPPEIRITACDKSGLALESGRILAEAAGFSFIAVPSWDATVDAPPEGSFDFVATGHVFNELASGKEDRIERRFVLARAAMDRVAPGGALLVLEPATTATSRDMIALRDRLGASGARVLAPCVRSGPCPALAQEGRSCHADFTWRSPSLVRELSLRTGLDKGLVKTASFAFAPGAPSGALSGALSGDGAAVAGPATTPESGGPRRYRVVSEPMLNKAGRVRVLICGEAGLFPLSAKPGEGFPAEAAHAALKRADLIELSRPAPRESGFAVGPDTRIVARRPVV